MKLYDTVIKECLETLKAYPCKRLDLQQNSVKDVGNQNLILRSDMAYELGGGNLSAVSGLAYTSDRELVNEDEVLLYGPDLPEIKENNSYARITLLRVAEDSLGDENEAYSTMRKVEYTRYNINPKGYMMRISVASNQEKVRVSRQALKEQLTFAKVGKLFLEGYHKEPKIQAVKMIFITLDEFPYKKICDKMSKSEEITNSLNHIFNNLKMDCSSCGLKPICDEVEGMRELHQKLI